MEPRIKQIKKILNKYGINVYNWRNEIAKEINDLFLESSPSEVCYPEKFVEWGINHKDLLIRFGTVSKLFTFWRDLPENKQ